MFELSMAALHLHLFPAGLMQHFYDISDIHPAFLARSEPARYQLSPLMLVGRPGYFTEDEKGSDPFLRKLHEVGIVEVTSS